MKYIIKLFSLLIAILIQSNSAKAQNIITLTWNDVIGISRIENLDLNIQKQEYHYQKLAVTQDLNGIDRVVSGQWI